MFRNIVVGVSGGVDSAVSAFLLKQKGYNVLGVFMKNWDEFDEMGRCSGEQDLLDAEYACKRVGIELRQVNYVRDYWNSVFTDFLDDYTKGLTPNPDILCNKYIKFDLFYNHAINKLKYDAIATGHYAATSFGPFLENYTENEDPLLKIPSDTFKDQTFFLSAIQRASLRRCMFPLGNLQKKQVKEIARHCGLERLAAKRESTGICFVGQRDFKAFIREYICSKPGPFIDISNGQEVGQHEGLHQWTIGQRCRLHSFLQPYYVAKKDVTTNTIYVASGHEHPALYSNTIQANSINWLVDQPLTGKAGDTFRCQFRFQHTKPLVDCSVFQGEDPHEVTIVLDTPLRAVTPGQYAVFYRAGVCLGSARITKAQLVKDDRKRKQVEQSR